MYGVIYLIQLPIKEDPRLLSLELFPHFDDAKKRTEELIKEFVEEYGEDYIEHASKENPVAIMFNGEVTGYAYIKKVSEKI